MDKIEEIVNHRALDMVYPSREAFRAALGKGKKMRIYLGVDATGPHIHLGHLTNFFILKRLQDLGHEIVFLIGDFTARIGDPTDKLAARRQLTAKEVKANYQSFKEQMGRILNLKGKNPVRIAFNGKWLSKMNFEDLIDLASHFTVQQMIERDMFQERIKAGKPIHVHEFFYPLMQGYDSVALDTDMELGGTDQTFNMLVGRDLLRAYKKKEKIVLTTKLLIDPMTRKKIMNKSEGGLINLDDGPADVFGKTMAIPDGAMLTIAELSTEMPDLEISQLREALKKGENPRSIKVKIATAVVATIYGEKAATMARESFENLFSRHEISGDVPELRIKEVRLTVLDLAVASGIPKSKSDARRLIEQGGFDVDKNVLRDPRKEVDIRNGMILKVGKRHFFRVVKG